MGRPSLKKQRTEEILEAYEACVIRYGVEGATLERVAAKAGIARPLIRHHVGNREDLLLALSSRFQSVTRDQVQEMVAYLPEKNRVQTLVELLFDDSYTDANMTQLAQALLTAAADREDLAQNLRDWVGKFMDMLNSEISAEYPEVERDAVEAVVAGIMGIYFNVDSFSTLGRFDRLQEASKAAVMRLLATLTN